MSGDLNRPIRAHRSPLGRAGQPAASRPLLTGGASPREFSGTATVVVDDVRNI